jgi:hypothetical protein
MQGDAGLQNRYQAASSIAAKGRAPASLWTQDTSRGKGENLPEFEIARARGPTTRSAETKEVLSAERMPHENGGGLSGSGSRCRRQKVWETRVTRERKEREREREKIERQRERERDERAREREEREAQQIEREAERDKRVRDVQSSIQQMMETMRRNAM